VEETAPHTAAAAMHTSYKVVKKTKKKQHDENKKAV
jgi:hypothetical protein